MNSSADESDHRQPKRTRAIDPTMSTISLARRAGSGSTRRVLQPGVR